MTLPHLWIGHLPIAALSSADWVDYYVSVVEERRRQRRSDPEAMPPPPVFTSANGHVLSRAARDRDFRQALMEADAIDADGMSLVIASRFLCPTALPDRCATTDLFHLVAREAEARRMSFFLLGGPEHVNATAARNTQRLYPALRIAGRHHGYIAYEDIPALLQTIDAAAPDILWLGLGIPREQLFAAAYRRQLPNVGMIKTCGGLFDFLAGARIRSPRWMQACGLEWLFRLAQEPRRLFFRYLITNPHAMWLMLEAANRRRGKVALSADRQEVSRLDDEGLSL